MIMDLNNNVFFRMSQLNDNNIMCKCFRLSAAVPIQKSSGLLVIVFRLFFYLTGQNFLANCWIPFLY